MSSSSTSSTQPVAATSDTRRRVKLYILNEDRQWDDKGTGYVSSIFIEHLKGLSLLVKAESDGSTLLESRIQPDIAYQKQQETLIVWSQDDNYDLALSFQEKAGCDEIWEKICQVQGKDPSVDVTQDIVDESEDEQFDSMPDTSAGAPVDLPACEISKLEEIAELFQNVLPSPIRRERLSVAIENEGYIHKLLELFHVCEDLEILDGLHHLYDIFKAIFMLNKNALFEIMFADDVIYNVIGCLEYDPALKKDPNSSSPPQRIKHREYLKKQAKFKEVIPITNQDLLAKIHQTYRVSYIQEIVLPTPSVFEENMLTTLSSFIFFNKVEIVSMIQDDEKFLTQLFFSLKDDETEETKRRDLVLFLKELCSFSQTLQPQNRESFFRTLSNQGILDALEILLGLESDSSNDASTSSEAGPSHAALEPTETPLAQIKCAAIDMFSFIVEFSPSMVREFVLQETQAPLAILQEDDADLLINLVIDQMISDLDPELGGAMQLMGILKILIDPENMVAQANKTEKTEFLTFFYKRSMPVLVAPILANTTDANQLAKDDYRTAHLQYLILELLAFCVEHHTFHIRNYVMNKDFLRRVLKLLKSRHAFLALAALRFMRKIVGLKDEFYNRYIIKGNLFLPVIEAFNRNGQRYNLLNSALLEIFEFVRVEDIKSLIQHVVEMHWEAVKHVDYVQTFKNLKIRYDQQSEQRAGVRDGRSVGAVAAGVGSNIENIFLNMSPIMRNNRFRRDARALDEEEEMWFDQEEPDIDGADANMARSVGEDDSSPPNSLQSPPRPTDTPDQIRDNAMDDMCHDGISSSERDASVAEAASSSSSLDQRELQATFLAAAAAVAAGMSPPDDAASSSSDDNIESNDGGETVDGPADSIDFAKMVHRNFKACDDNATDAMTVESRFKTQTGSAEMSDSMGVCSSTSGATHMPSMGGVLRNIDSESGNFNEENSAAASSSVSPEIACDVSSGSNLVSALKSHSEAFLGENALSSTTKSPKSAKKNVDGSCSEFDQQVGLDYTSPASTSGGSLYSARSEFPVGDESLVDTSAKEPVAKDACSTSFESPRRRLPSIETIDPSSSIGTLPAVSDIIGPSATPPGPFSQLAAGCSNAATVVTSSPLMAAAIADAMAAAVAASSTNDNTGAISSSQAQPHGREPSSENAVENPGPGLCETASARSGAALAASSVNQLLDLSKATNTAASFMADSSASQMPFVNAAPDPCHSSSQVTSSTYYGQELSSNASKPSPHSSAALSSTTNPSSQTVSCVASSSSANPSSNSSSSEDLSRSAVPGQQRIGLVDYEADSDEEEEEYEPSEENKKDKDDDDDSPSVKRARLST